MRLLRIVGGFVLVLVPILFVYGFIRVGWLGYPLGTYTLVDGNSDGLIDNITFSENYGGFLPSASEFISMLVSFPSFEEYLAPAIEFWNNANFAMGATEIVDFASFFTAVGNFFTLVGGVFYLGAMLISYPFAVLGFIFTNLFTPYNA